MLRSRQVMQRNEQVAMDEVRNLFAVRTLSTGSQLFPQELGSNGVSGGGPALTLQEVNAVCPELRSSDVIAFQKAGWRFVVSEQLLNDKNTMVAQVMIKAGRRAALLINRLTLQVSEHLSELLTEALLAEHLGRIVGKFKFAKGLYEVAVDLPAGTDILDVANELNALPDVTFAEPQFVEVLEGR